MVTLYECGYAASGSVAAFEAASSSFDVSDAASGSVADSDAASLVLFLFLMRH